MTLKEFFEEHRGDILQVGYEDFQIDEDKLHPDLEKLIKETFKAGYEFGGFVPESLKEQIWQANKERFLG